MNKTSNKTYITRAAETFIDICEETTAQECKNKKCIICNTLGHCINPLNWKISEEDIKETLTEMAMSPQTTYTKQSSKFIVRLIDGTLFTYEANTWDYITITDKIIQIVDKKGIVQFNKDIVSYTRLLKECEI